MTHARSLKSAALVTMTAAATTFLIQACGGGGDAQAAAETANPIEGTWEATVTIKDCTSGAVLRTFKGESLFHRGGTLTADNSMPPPSRGIAFGGWKQDSTNNYTVRFHFLRFNPDGTLAGSQNVTRAMVLSADGNSVTGTINGQVLDTNGGVLQPVCGSEAGVRLY